MSAAKHTVDILVIRLANHSYGLFSNVKRLLFVWNAGGHLTRACSTGSRLTLARSTGGHLLQGVIFYRRFMSIACFCRSPSTGGRLKLASFTGGHLLQVVAFYRRLLSRGGHPLQEVAFYRRSPSTGDRLSGWQTSGTALAA